MKNLFLTQCLLILTVLSFGADPFSAAVKEPASKSTDSYYHHCGEFHVTPSTDYLLYQKGTNFTAPSPYEFRMPFIGFDLGGQYMYRPVELFGVSAGLGFRMQGNYIRHTTTPLFQDKYVDYRLAGHTGFLQVPIEFHLFKRMSHCTFEFATGPQFNFPVFTMTQATTYHQDGSKIATNKDKTTYGTDYMRQNAMLGWNIVLGGELHLCDHGDLFIGPQINFANLAFFNKEINTSAKENGRYYDCSLGLKLGFRFHCDKTAGYATK